MKAIPRAIEHEPITQTFGASAIIRDQRHIEQVITSLPPADSELASRFIGELQANSLSVGSIANYASAIKSLSDLGKPFANLERGDIVKWARGLERYSPATISLRKILAKRFLKWVFTGSLDGNEYPDCVAWLKPRQPRKRLPKQVLSELEIRQLVEATATQRDRTLVHMGYESGARGGELLALRIKDVEFDSFGAVIRLSGKTGERRVRVVQCAPDLKIWISMHPQKDNLDAPLWPALRGAPKPISLRTWEGLLQSLATSAGIKKHVHPHLLRHSRATVLANVLTEAQMKVFFGWSKGSNMPQIYTHLSGKHVDDAILRHYGLRVEEDKEALKALVPKRCPSCMQDNPTSARFCMNCHSPLDLASVSEAQRTYEQAENVAVRWIKWMLEHASPELKERSLKESGLGEEIKKIVKA